MKHNLIVCSLLFSLSAIAVSQTQQVTLNSSPSRSVGQPALPPESGAANRVEGREFNGPVSVAIDTTGATPILYVSDFGNNRVLAWKNAASFSNGATADLVIGQPDLLSTGQQGPSHAFNSGFTGPTGLAVYKGDLYVADSGNNRVLRFPKPFDQQASKGSIVPDLWLGQGSLNTRTPNYTGSVSEKGLALATTNSIFVGNILAFDGNGNLWVADGGNLRVIRFPAAQLACSNCTSNADIVIGQGDLKSTATPLPNTQQSYTVKNQIGVPGALAFDSTGRLYVSDQIGAQGRVLVFSNPSGQSGNASADRIMGIIQSSQVPTGLSSADQAVYFGKITLNNPNGLFILPDNSVGVVDTSYNRILIFPSFDKWPAEGTLYSPQASFVVGQKDFVTVSQNGVAAGTTPLTPPPSAASLSGPYGATYLASTNELFVADSANNRVIALPSSGGSFGSATRVLGQDLMNQYSINLVEGKEFQFPGDAGIALDTSSSTPHLWVSDPANHRVLGFADARKIGPGSRADIVIGQPDLAHAVCNYPSGDVSVPTASNLCDPIGVLVDSQGNLYVADSLNGRVLRFHNPFQNPGAVLPQADLVLGQPNFVSTIKQPGQNTMGRPYGLAFSGNNGLLVTDTAYNRVLYFQFSSNGTFNAGTDNGINAAKVFGQSNFVNTGTGTLLSQFNTPRHIATDTNGQFYVVDSANNRVLVFSDPANPQTSNNAQASLVLPQLNAPRGIYVNSGTGEIWVANTNSGTLVRYPKYDTLIFNATPNATLQNVVNNTLIPTYAVAQDQYGDLFVADADNRVIVYYQGFTAVNAATSLARPIAPMMLATLYPAASATQFGNAAPATASGTTWPTTMADIQVTVNGELAPLYYVSPGQINFYVPKDLPTSPNPTVEVEVIQASTGQVLGAQQVPVATIAPGIYTTCGGPSSGTLREACVLNEDNTVNSSSNPAARGTVIQIFGTGQGVVSNAPADGNPAPTSPLATTINTPRVIIGTDYVDAYPTQPGDVGTSGSHSTSWVSYSGLTPGYIGLWQVNVQIPMAVPPSTNPTLLDVVLNGQGAWDTTSGFRTTIYVK